MGIISFILGVSAYMNRSVINEIFSLSVALMFILMIIYCFTYKTDKLGLMPKNGVWNRLII
jgi:hypothetical protein